MRIGSPLHAFRIPDLSTSFYMDVYSFFKTENERSLVLRIINDNIAAAQLNNFLDLLLKAGEIIRVRTAYWRI